jgi:hypothetical protein
MDRIDRLERSLFRWKAGTLAVAVVATGVGFQQNAKWLGDSVAAGTIKVGTIEAREIVLKDESGRLHGAMGCDGDGTRFTLSHPHKGGGFVLSQDWKSSEPYLPVKMSFRDHRGNYHRPSVVDGEAGDYWPSEP